MLICLLLKITRGRTVREFPYKTWLWAGIFLLYPWVAYAAGLGKLTILSSLGQPLAAEIDLVSVQKDELSTLSARVASPDAFQQANMQYSPALIGVRMTIERRGDGKPFIRIVSTRSINDPFLAILIELSWSQGRLLREYTALLDPPGYTPVPAPVTPPVATATPAAPNVSAESKPIAPAQAEASGTAARGAKPSPRTATPKSASPSQAGSDEVAVKRGDTLAKIAAGVKPEGVTLDQMLVSLYRNNTEAFAGANMNRLKTGAILRVPDKDRIADTAPVEATKEVRVQSSNWNAYRMKLAEASGNAPTQEGGKSASSGKITTAVEDQSVPKQTSQEVLKLSKGDTPAAGKTVGGKPMSAKDRVRMLEEEAVAREKSLAEANERVAQLEKNIKDMQRLLEIKGVVPPGAKPPATPAAPAAPAKADQVAKAEPPKAEAPKAEPPKAEPMKAEPPKDAAKAGDPAKAEQKGAPLATGEAVKGDAPITSEAPKAAEAPKAEAPKAAPPPAKKAPPPPPPVAEPSLVDQIMTAVSDPIYLAGGIGGLVLLGGGALWAARRRRTQAFDDEIKTAKTAPTLAGKPAAAAAASLAASPVIAPVAGGDDVDPLAEADLYLNFGRDAQAEEVLKEALQKNPQHSEAQLKLLQIYAARKDKTAFEKIANGLHTQTSGVGDTWIKAAGMGYAFDPDNALYEAGKLAPAAAAPAVAAGPIGGTDLDFDLELSPGGSATGPDMTLESGDKTVFMPPGQFAGLAGDNDTTATHDITHDSVTAQAFSPDPAATPDFTLNGPAAGSGANMTDITADSTGDQTKTTQVTGDSAVKSMVSAIDFDFDAPAAPPPLAPFRHDSTIVMTPENQEKATDLNMDIDVGGPPASTPASATVTGTSSVVQIDPTFKLDLGAETTVLPVDGGAGAPAAIPDIKLDDISLSLDDVPKAVDAPAPAAGGAKDDHWYDVQTKFDLAKAYQEMGDKDGAREILQEVIKEGDSAQQAEAKQLLDSLG
jgi:pilus assembly protein FimV